MNSHTGSCLCGNIRFRAEGKPTFPHLCSCRMCQLWSGAPTVAWVEFQLDGFDWVGPDSKPTFYKSSDKTQRGSCPKCGSSICAIDEGYDKISISMSTLDDSSSIKLGKQHSFQNEAPSWWPLAIPPAAKK